MIINQSDSFSYIKDNLNVILDEISEAKIKANRTDEVRFMAVTKTVEPEKINFAIENGIDLIGENRVQEYLSKCESYKPCETHFIGHLQTNKVKFIAEKVSMIESVDSVHLAEAISKECKKIGKDMDILLEINSGSEISKSGFSFEEVKEAAREIAKIDNIHIKGLMTIPPIVDAERFFEKMQSIYIDIQSENIDNIDMRWLSMGMSGDFPLAIQYGANIVRIGTKLFGARNYNGGIK